MKRLEESRAKKVFSYFEELCKIPHGSGNTKAISDYCAAFAKERGLFYKQDELNNIIIKKPATPGYENQKIVIIQGHLDMVCECEPGTTFDFEQNGLDLYIEGDYLSAKNTTLGGDDGIAIACALAVLDSDDLAHPAIEAVFTVDEEVGLLGAAGIDVSCLEGRWLLNLDSEEEGSFLAGCAGGLRSNCTIPICRESAEGTMLTLTITGLQGGHSGTEIKCEHGNAINISGRVLGNIADRFPVKLEAMNGGLMDNAIPREVVIRLLADQTDVAEIFQCVDEMEAILKKEHQITDPDVCIRKEENGVMTAHVLTQESLSKILVFLESLPRGIQNMCVGLGDLVETSLNAGIMKLTETQFHVNLSVRSSVISRRDEVAGRIKRVCEYLGGSYEVTGPYPAWEYRKDSVLRDRICEVYEQMYGKQPLIEVIHAGLECGLFSNKIPNLECVSFGPDIKDIHTPKERLSISSTERMWDFVVEFLKTGCK